MLKNVKKKHFKLVLYVDRFLQVLNKKPEPFFEHYVGWLHLDDIYFGMHKEKKTNTMTWSIPESI